MRNLRNSTSSRESGAVSIKTLLFLVIIAVVAFLSIKIVPVYVEQQRVVHDVNELARIAGVRGWKEDRIKQDIKRITDEYSLPETGINYTPTGEKGGQISISYQRDIDLLVTTYQYKVDQTTSLGKEL